MYHYITKGLWTHNFVEVKEQRMFIYGLTCFYIKWQTNQQRKNFLKQGPLVP